MAHGPQMFFTKQITHQIGRYTERLSRFPRSSLFHTSFKIAPFVWLANFGCSVCRFQVSCHSEFSQPRHVFIIRFVTQKQFTGIKWQISPVPGEHNPILECRSCLLAKRQSVVVFPSGTRYKIYCDWEPRPYGCPLRPQSCFYFEILRLRRSGYLIWTEGAKSERKFQILQSTPAKLTKPTSVSGGVPKTEEERDAKIDAILDPAFWYWIWWILNYEIRMPCNVKHKLRSKNESPFIKKLKLTLPTIFSGAKDNKSEWGNPEGFCIDCHSRILSNRWRNAKRVLSMIVF